MQYDIGYFIYENIKNHYFLDTLLIIINFVNNIVWIDIIHSGLIRAKSKVVHKTKLTMLILSYMDKGPVYPIFKNILIK